MEDGLWHGSAWYGLVSSWPAWFLHVSLRDDHVVLQFLLARSEQFWVLFIILCVAAVCLGVVLLKLFSGELVPLFWFRVSVTLLSVYNLFWLLLWPGYF